MTLLVVIYPINVVPAFMLFTKQDLPRVRRHTALRAVLIAAALPVGFIIAGQILLEALGQDLPSSSIAGAWCCWPWPCKGASARQRPSPGRRI